MFFRRIHLTRLFGIPIRLDLSWFVLVALLSWTLATGWFPEQLAGAASLTYWTMGLSAALGLFACVLLHELAHALVARRFGLEMRGITLFIFGGVAELPSEPPSAKAEFFVAIAGPIASAAIAGLLFLATWVGEAIAAPEPATLVVGYLAFLNVVLVAFNVIPAFPLDGGRVLRAILWHTQKDLRKATNITASLGWLFGAFLIALGVIRIIGGNFIGGMWSALIGLFLQGAAEMSKRNVFVRETLGDVGLRRFLREEPQAVSADASIQSLVDDHFLRHFAKIVPVVDAGRLVGCVTTSDVQAIDRSDWPSSAVRSITRPCDASNTVSSETKASECLRRLSTNGASRLLVVDGDRLRGFVTLHDLSRYLARKQELEEAE